MIWHVLLIYIDQDKINSTNTVKLLSSIAAMQLNVFSRLEKFMGKKKKIYDQQLYFLTFNHLFLVCIWTLFTQCHCPLVSNFCSWVSAIKIRGRCVKSVCIRSFCGPYFPAFGLNTEIYGVSFRIQSKCRKIRTRKTPNTDTFNAVVVLNNFKSYYETLLKNSNEKSN